MRHATSGRNFLRSAFSETADQTSQRDYRPIVIGSQSIGAPLILRHFLYYMYKKEIQSGDKKHCRAILMAVCDSKLILQQWAEDIVVTAIDDCIAGSHHKSQCFRISYTTRILPKNSGESQVRERSVAPWWNMTNQCFKWFKGLIKLHAHPLVSCESY